MSRPVHFEILTEHPERVAEFYHTVLGWQTTTWDGPQSYWLVTTGSNESPGINGGITHRHFGQAVINTVAVESLPVSVEKVLAAGGETVNEPQDIPGVGRHVYCKDPDGNLFGMMQPTPPEDEGAHRH